MRLVAATLPLLLCLAAPAPASADDAATGRRVTVTGSATVSAPPDIATISGGIETRAETAATAFADNSEAMRAVFGALDGLGVARADIQTTRLSLEPVWAGQGEEDTPPRIVGYEAANMVTITVRETGRLGEIVDALGSGGANRIHGIDFSIGDPRPLLEKAREEAVADARAKAETLTRSAGVTLGDVLTIDEGTRGGPAPIGARMEMAAAPIAEGTVEVGTEVTVTYALR